MPNFRSVLQRSTFAASLLGAGTSLTLAAEFQALNFIGGNTVGNFSGLSADGLVVVGGGNYQPFRWTAAGGTVALGAPNGTDSYAYDVNADGSVIVGYGFPGSNRTINEAARWTTMGGWSFLGFLPGGALSIAQGVNADGTVVAGASTTTAYVPGGPIRSQAYRWTAGTGMVGLGFLPGDNNSQAAAVNADGSVIVGSSRLDSLTIGGGTLGVQAFRWTSSTGMVGLGFLPGRTFSDAAGVSNDGNVVVGSSFLPSLPREAFRWTQASGMVGLGTLSGDVGSHAWSVSGDGNVVIGYSTNAAGTQRAFRWTATTGMQSVTDILTAQGVSLGGMRLDVAGEASFDGTIIAGGGTNGLGAGQAWVATIPLDAFALLDLNGTNRELGTLLWSGTVTNTAANSPATFTAGASNLNTTFTGFIRDGSSATAFRKIGTGTITLQTTNTYSGATTIEAGKLLVNGSIASSSGVAVNSGATLGGTGTVAGVTVASGGTVAPGNSVGTLKVAGDINFAANSVYVVEIDANGNADRIDATGRAILSGGMVQGELAPGAPLGIYTIVNAPGGVTGAFAGASSNTANVTSSLIYGPNSVSLKLLLNNIQFGNYGTTPNQIATGFAISAGGSASGLYSALALVAVNPAAVAPALSALSGEIHASIRGAAIEDSRIIRDAVLDRIGPRGDRPAIWGAGFGSYGFIFGDANASGLHHDSTGMIAGIDVPLSGGFNIGLAGALVTNHASLADRASHARGDSGHLIVYGGWTDGEIVIRLGGDYGVGTNTITRNILAISEIESSRQDQDTRQVFADLAYRFTTNTAAFEPYVNLAHVAATSGAFVETGGSATLAGPSVTDARTYIALGGRASLPDLTVNEMIVVPRIDLGWQHAFGRLNTSQPVAFQGLAQNFVVSGAPLGRDTATVKAGADLRLLPDVLISVGYSGSFSDGSENHALIGQLGWTW